MREVWGSIPASYIFEGYNCIPVQFIKKTLRTENRTGFQNFKVSRTGPNQPKKKKREKKNPGSIRFIGFYFHP